MALSIGNSKVSKLYLGDTECKKAYLGDTIVFNNETSPKLPEEYTQVEYVSFGGLNDCFYLQEGIKCDTDRFVYKFIPYTMGIPNAIRYIFYFISYINGANYLMYCRANDKKSLEFLINEVAGNDPKTINIDYYKNVLEFDFDFMNNKYMVNGISLSGFKDSRLLESYRFIGYYGLSLIGECYGFTHYRDGEIIHNYLPCTNQYGVPGIFDINSQTFIQNYDQSSTTITAGPPV